MQDIILYREDGEARAIGVKHVLVHHSPTGFEWGYHGSGCAELARNILHMFTDPGTRDKLYQQFKVDFIAPLPVEGGTIKAETVRKWLEEKGAGEHE